MKARQGGIAALYVHWGETAIRDSPLNIPAIANTL